MNKRSSLSTMEKKMSGTREIEERPCWSYEESDMTGQKMYRIPRVCYRVMERTLLFGSGT